MLHRKCQCHLSMCPVLFGALVALGVVVMAMSAGTPPVLASWAVVVPPAVMAQPTVAIPPTVVQQTMAAPQTTATPVAPPTKSYDWAAIQAAYKTSSHSNDYGLGRGPNTFCARCHSPRNWDPASRVDPAPNCVSCKFPFDKEVRRAKSNVLVPQAEWKNIGCDICHRVDSQGAIDPAIAIWNQAKGEYDAVATPTELCEKCHADSIGGSRHKITVGGPAMTTEIGLTQPRPTGCTDCHDPHSQKASCVNCHKSLSNAAGHDKEHAIVGCDACHDAAGLKLAPTSDNKVWAAFIAVSSPAGGPPTLTQVTSHVLQKAVDCRRCHYDNNPQKLRSLVTPTVVRGTATPVRTPAPSK